MLGRKLVGNCSECNKRIRKRTHNKLDILTKDKDQEKVDQSGIYKLCEDCIDKYAQDAQNALTVPCAECETSFIVTPLTMKKHVLSGKYNGKELIYLLCSACKSKHPDGTKIEIWG